MCSGGEFNIDVDLESVKYNRYKCRDCDNTFKGAGKRPICPSCGCEEVDQMTA